MVRQALPRCMAYASHGWVRVLCAFVVIFTSLLLVQPVLGPGTREGRPMGGCTPVHSYTLSRIQQQCSLALSYPIAASSIPTDSSEQPSLGFPPALEGQELSFPFVSTEFQPPLARLLSYSTCGTAPMRVGTAASSGLGAYPVCTQHILAASAAIFIHY
ncbi:hypothetical protein KIL84_003646 [Mauremys mutica]|uniref:Uncharacterized protein n=1 Tax=Mauremys mutica TaxID=74926 RepID=A0A9D4ARF0_9SAUR|nr:hypothetical protein KIL84_003646 [Mauremys mutica]